jgi:hypothetical protein
MRKGRFLALLCCWVVWLSLFELPASGQGELTVKLTDLNTSAFPQITAYLDVHSASGIFLNSLTTDNLNIIEAGQPLPVDMVSIKKTGVQFVIAITLGPAMGIRDGQGINRLEYVLQGMGKWQPEKDPAALDDYSLIATVGPEIIHQSDPSTLLEALASYQPNARDAAPSLQILSRALQIAEDSTPQPGMEKAVLFITPLHTVNATTGLENLTERAHQSGIRVYVWLVSSPDLADTVLSVDLQNLAWGTGGLFFTFSGTEAIPDIEQYLQELRYIYQLSYTSQLRQSGTYPVTIEVNINGTQATSPENNLALELRPPTPIFISPPIEIVRKYTVAEVTASAAPFKETVSQFTPEVQVLKILTEFPDGSSRSVVQSILYVDNLPVATNTSPPFDQFNWDLRVYGESSTHMLHVEVVDNLGLSGTSAGIPVKITVEEPALSVKMVLNSRGYLLAGLSLLVAGLILVLVLVAAGRIGPAAMPRKQTLSQNSRHSWRAGERFRRTRLDPVTQPVTLPSETPVNRLPRWVHRIKWPQRQTSSKARVFLTPLSAVDENEPESPIPITTDEIIFGRDTRATWVIEDPSLDAIHARLVREGSAYRLIDNQTTAGTWVNYEHTAPDGTILKNGDLIHIGQIRFRFTHRESGQTRKINVQPQEFTP